MSDVPAAALWLAALVALPAVATANRGRDRRRSAGGAMRSDDCARWC